MEIFQCHEFSPEAVSVSILCDFSGFSRSVVTPISATSQSLSIENTSLSLSWNSRNGKKNWVATHSNRKSLYLQLAFPRSGEMPRIAVTRLTVSWPCLQVESCIVKVQDSVHTLDILVWLSHIRLLQDTCNTSS